MKFKTILSVVIIICVFCTGAYGLTVTTPDGNSIDISALNEADRTELLNSFDKISASKKSMGETSKVITNIMTDPHKLDAWRKLLTGTIKDICNDLNVSVNEFIKTPAGAGVAGLIIYKIIGKDFLTTTVRLLIVIPLWFFVVIISLMLRRSYFGTKTVYDTVPIEVGGKTEIKKTNPKQVRRYTFDSNDVATGIAIIIAALPVLATITMIFIFFGG